MSAIDGRNWLALAPACSRATARQILLYHKINGHFTRRGGLSDNIPEKMIRHKSRSHDKHCFSWLRLWWGSWRKQLSSHPLGQSLDSLIVYEHLLVLKGPVYFVCFGSDEFPQGLFRFACLDSHVHIPYKIRLCTSSCLFDVYFSVFSSSL